MLDFKDNTDKILEAFETWQGEALNLIGAAATAHTQDNTPVRTGLLVNSADWEVDVTDSSVSVGFKHSDNKNKNPFYAIYVEEGSRTNRPQHMLRRGINDYKDEYKEIAKRSGENQ